MKYVILKRIEVLIEVIGASISNIANTNYKLAQRILVKTSYKPVITPRSDFEYSTQRTGPAWQANTASQVPLEMDHIRAVQSSLPVITVSPTILIDLHKTYMPIKVQRVSQPFHTLSSSSPDPLGVS